MGLISLVKVDSSGTSVTIFPKANCGVSCAFTPRSTATASTIIPKRAATAVAFLAFIVTVIIIIVFVVVVVVVVSQSVPPLSLPVSLCLSAAADFVSCASSPAVESSF